MLKGDQRVRTRGVFPQAPAGPSLELIDYLLGTRQTPPAERRKKKAVGDLSALGILAIDKDDRMAIDEPAVLDGATIILSALRRVVEKAPGCQRCFAMLADDPATPSAELGKVIQEAWAADWKPETVKGIGRNVRSWARACGLGTRIRKPKFRSRRTPGQISNP